MPSTLAALLDVVSAENASAPAVIGPQRIVSYAELADESRRLARGLEGLGVACGDRVAIWLPNIAAWPAMFFACARIGAIAVAVNTRFKGGELADIVRRSRAKVLVFWPGFKEIDFTGILAEIDPAALDGIEHYVVYREDDSARPEPLHGRRVLDYHELARCQPLVEDRASPDSGCVMFTTSGTTRAPKFVLHRQAALLDHARDIARGLDLHAPDTVVYLAMPFCAAGGFSQLLPTFALGRPLVTLPAFDAGQAAALIQAHRATHSFLVGNMVASLLDAAPGARPFPSLRRCAFAAFTPSEAAIAIEAEARGIPLIGIYGSSELQALYALQPLSLPIPARTQGGGRPLAASAAVRVRDPDSGRLLPPGVSGELEFIGPSRMVAYDDNAEASAAAFTDDGYFRSGDLGFIADDGRFIYQNRIGDVLRLAGFLVSPVEIEGFLKEHADVADAQVVGVEIAGAPRAVAFVIPSARSDAGAFDEAALLAHCRQRMANYKVPARILAIEAFPVTQSANGNKIQKNRLRDLARERVAGNDRDIG